MPCGLEIFSLEQNIVVHPEDFMVSVYKHANTQGGGGGPCRNIGERLMRYGSGWSFPPAVHKHS